MVEKNKELIQERIQGRKQIIKALYMFDIRKCSITDTYEAIDLSDFTVATLEGVAKNLEAVDDLIIANLKNWSLKRLNYVDRAIIRLAVYEMKFTDTANEIVINEAIELSKEFTQTDDFNSKAFNNRLLDNILKNL